MTHGSAGEARAAELISDAMKKAPGARAAMVARRGAGVLLAPRGTGFIELRRIDVAKEIANTIANSQNMVRGVDCCREVHKQEQHFAQVYLSSDALLLSMYDKARDKERI